MELRKITHPHEKECIHRLAYFSQTRHTGVLMEMEKYNVLVMRTFGQP